MSDAGELCLSLFESRGTVRLGGLYCRVSYTKQGHDFIYTAEGSIKDFGATGCRIRGTSSPIVGSQILLMFERLTEAPPQIICGRVRWIGGKFLALTFLD
ncbi:MAG TPA: hypothetical protein VJ746_12650 [Nitrospira sp.]|nr:hypothetical protein [Nitrospira sp.]